MRPDRRKIPNMITHLWRGGTTVDNAEAYERFLLGELFSSMREIPGFRGADILRRLEHDEVALVTLTRFDSVTAIQTFAGDDYETPTSLRPQAGASADAAAPGCEAHRTAITASGATVLKGVLVALGTYLAIVASEVLVSIGLAVVFALGFDPLVPALRGSADLARAAVAALAARPLTTHRARCGEFWRPFAIPVNHL
jgi:hypothetical protein